MNWTRGVVIGGLVAAACARSPAYERPDAELPAAFRGEIARGPGLPSQAESIADQAWWQVFQDEGLKALVGQALERNYDARIAAARILQAEAQLGIARADQLPALDADMVGVRTPDAAISGAAGAAGFGGSSSASFPFGTTGFTSGPRSLLQMRGTLSWSLDFWGRYRGATEAARALLRASEWGQRAVRTTLVSQVATAYFALRTLDLQLEISRRTQRSREESLRITQVRERGGTAALIDVRQAQQLVYGAAVRSADLERQIEQQENQIRTLVGDYAGALPRDASWIVQAPRVEVPAGLPSGLLERRPDIRAAEAQLVAANAQIGVARAAYFPDISLTGAAGGRSDAFASLFRDGPFWLLSGDLLQPVFEGGRLRSGVELAQARRAEALLAYRSAILNAFRETSDALIGYVKGRETRERQESLLLAAQDGRRLAGTRYEGGVTSYLEVLVADEQLFEAELVFADAKRAELAALVEIYRALGGGWQL